MKALIASTENSKIEAASKALLIMTGRKVEVFPAPCILDIDPETDTKEITDHITRNFKIIRGIGDYSCYIACATSLQGASRLHFAKVGTKEASSYILGADTETEAIISALRIIGRLKEE